MPVKVNPTCECGRQFKLAAHLGRHAPRCLGPEPKLTDLYRIGMVTQSGDCIEWNGKRNDQGYGILSDVAREQLGEARVHRAALRLSGVEIPTGYGVLHSCDNPPCIYPGHLRPGTQRDNAADMTARGRFGGRFQPGVKEVRLCPICGAKHERLPGEANMTCSLSCAAKLSWRTAPRREIARSGGEARHCIICGGGFSVDRPSIPTKTCGATYCVGQARWITRRGAP